MKKQAKLIATSIFLISLILVFAIRGERRQDGEPFGKALPGTTAEQLTLFNAGKQEFEQVEEIEDGLGPIFNARSCAECHAIPAVGGSGFMNEVRAGREAEGAYDDLPGGSLYQLFSINPEKCQEVVPSNANIMAFRQATSLFGAGLIEAIPDETILARADPDDRNLDGISGRVHIVLDVPSNKMRVGRFGWKAQQASLLGFSADAYLNEMGITSDLAPRENAPNGDEAKLKLCDVVADPEDKRDPKTGRRGIDNFENFMRFLAPPPRGPITPQVMRGEALFNSIGCAQCHTPVMQTGDNRIEALNRKPVPLYSDLLLHDVETGDGIIQGAAPADVLRTPPLWGLRASGPYLHDGSAGTIEQAVLRHGGEAFTARFRYTMSATAQKRDLLAFLSSL